MLEYIRKFLSPEAPATPQDPEAELKLATCAILLEVAHVDEEYSKKEEAWIHNIISKHWNLSHEEVESLKKEAERARNDAIDIFQFSKPFRENYSDSQRMKVVEMVWEVILADDKVDEHEELLVRRIADLFVLTHGQMIESKVKVLKERGQRMQLGTET